MRRVSEVVRSLPFRERMLNHRAPVGVSFVLPLLAACSWEPSHACDDTREPGVASLYYAEPMNKDGTPFAPTLDEEYRVYLQFILEGDETCVESVDGASCECGFGSGGPEPFHVVDARCEACEIVRIGSFDTIGLEIIVIPREAVSMLAVTGMHDASGSSRVASTEVKLMTSR
jgi:hypothetical protein